MCSKKRNLDDLKEFPFTIEASEDRMEYLQRGLEVQWTEYAYMTREQAGEIHQPLKRHCLRGIQFSYPKMVFCY